MTGVAPPHKQIHTLVNVSNTPTFDETSGRCKGSKYFSYAIGHDLSGNACTNSAMVMTISCRVSSPSELE
eukprot:3510049-Amphidinium_carterae.1